MNVEGGAGNFVVENKGKQRGLHLPTYVSDEETIMFFHLHSNDMHLGLILCVR